jgi:hypothetical protein
MEANDSGDISTVGINSHGHHPKRGAMTTTPSSSLGLSYASSFSVIDDNTIYVLGTDGNLWLEHAVNGKFGQVPPPREPVDGNVLAFQAVDANTIFVLGTDGNLWLEHAINSKFGQVPPPRELVDGNVIAFQAIDVNSVFVLDKGGLYLDHVKQSIDGRVLPILPRETVNVAVAAFQALDENAVYFLDAGGNLMLTHRIISSKKYYIY